MPITVQCTCGKRLKAKDEAAGRTAKCPVCGNPVTFPALEADPAWEKPKEDVPPMKAEKTTGGNARFLAVVSTLAVAVVIGSISLINWNINRQRKAEASEKLRQTMTEAAQEANASVLAGKLDTAAESLRKAVHPKPTVEPGDPNKALVDQAENLLMAIETASATPKAVAYLQSFDDEKLAAILNGQNELTAGIPEPKVKKVIDDKFTRLVPNIQAKRGQVAQAKREQELASDPAYQKQQFLAWVDTQQQAILERDGELRQEIETMESEYRSSLFKPMTTRGIENVLEEWGGKREKMLEARMKVIGDAVQSFAEKAAKHPVWRVGTEADQLWVAENFAKSLKNMVNSLERPVENQLASLERTFGDKVHRGFRQLDEDQAKGTARLKDIENAFKGRLR